MIKKLLVNKETSDPAASKKVWKKGVASRVQKSIRSKEGKMDIEITEKSREDDDRGVMDMENDPMCSVKGIINNLDTNHNSLTNSSSELDFEPGSKCKSNQEQYDRYYGAAYAAALKKNIPNLENFMKNTNISEGLRAKMIDWMQEVFNYFRPESDDFTFFKAVTIMDLYIKNNQRQPNNKLQDSDVHLVGLTAIFIASKYEDNRHILIDQLIANACRGKFQVPTILAMEWEILLAIGFNTSIPTHIECLDSILSGTFEDLNGEFFHQIRFFALYLLKTCLYFSEMIMAPMDMVSLACAILSIHSNFDNEAIRLLSEKNQSIESITMEKNTLVLLILLRLPR
jgi:hypothetical protein